MDRENEVKIEIMNITFLIGNGFDLRVGMKTRFTDMYEGYFAQSSVSDSIQKFKDILKADAPKFKTWGDFEMAMAQKARDFKDEDAFIECLRDFKLYMASHLQREQSDFLKRLSVSKEARNLCMREMSKSMDDFYEGLTPNVINRFQSLGSRNNPKYNVISFNYTKVFDELLPTRFGVVTHIHGTLEADIVLGADNLSQVKELPYISTRRFERAFIKPEFNKSYDSARVDKAETIIQNSDVICIYGMSLGKSDLSWICRIKEWLLSHKKNHLVCFVYDERKFNRLNWDAIMDEEDDRIATFLGKICDSGEEMSKISNQIHIPVGYDIFGFDEILTNEHKRVMEDNYKRSALHKQLEEVTR